MGERNTKTFSISSVEYMCFQSYEELKAMLPQKSIIYISNCGRNHKQLLSLLQHLDICCILSYNESGQLVYFSSMYLTEIHFFSLFEGVQQALHCHYFSLTKMYWESEEEQVTVIYRSLVSYNQGQTLVCSDISCYFSFTFIRSGSWQLYGWWVKIGSSNKCQNKKHAQVAFPVQTQYWKERLENVSSFLISKLKVNSHFHQIFWAELFCECSNESAFPHRGLCN